MAKTIKVKELLNMENLPENIRINGISFKRTEFNKFDALYANNINVWWTNCTEILLDNEVEIIEDEQELDIQNIEDEDLFDNGQSFNDFPIVIKSYDDNFSRITKKLNELVQAVKQIDNKLKEK